MNREIKFRAQRTDTKEFVYGYYHEVEAEGVGYSYIFWQGNTIPVSADSVGQFTGLLDKNGKEIYADDLLKDEHGVIFRIYHVAGGYIMKENYWKANCKELNATDELIYCPLADSQNKSLVKYSCEIIGNIYENPNLIN